VAPLLFCAQANFSSDCRGMQAQLSALGGLVRLLDPELSAYLVRPSLVAALQRTVAQHCCEKQGFQDICLPCSHIPSTACTLGARFDSCLQL
jgi:hypothetical protein